MFLPRRLRIGSSAVRTTTGDNPAEGSGAMASRPDVLGFGHREMGRLEEAVLQKMMESCE